jgi:predicted acyl esterase
LISPAASPSADLRLAQGLAPGDRSGALEALAALAPAHPRRAEAGRAGQDRGIPDRDFVDGNLFKAGHRICLDITSLELPSGLAGAHDIEYAPYHICSSKTVVHRIYHDEQHPSHLVLPVIPLG